MHGGRRRIGSFLVALGTLVVAFAVAAPFLGPGASFSARRGAATSELHSPAVAVLMTGERLNGLLRGADGHGRTRRLDVEVATADGHELVVLVGTPTTIARTIAAPWVDVNSLPGFPGSAPAHGRAGGISADVLRAADVAAPGRVFAVDPRAGAVLVARADGRPGIDARVRTAIEIAPTRDALAVIGVAVIGALLAVVGFLVRRLPGRATADDEPASLRPGTIAP
jgi:hypothetical protein